MRDSHRDDDAIQHQIDGHEATAMSMASLNPFRKIAPRTATSSSVTPDLTRHPVRRVGVVVT